MQGVFDGDVVFVYTPEEHRLLRTDFQYFKDRGTSNRERNMGRDVLQRLDGGASKMEAAYKGDRPRGEVRFPSGSRGGSFQLVPWHEEMAAFLQGYEDVVDSARLFWGNGNRRLGEEALSPEGGVPSARDEETASSIWKKIAQGFRRREAAGPVVETQDAINAIKAAVESKTVTQAKIGSARRVNTKMRGLVQQGRNELLPWVVTLEGWIAKAIQLKKSEDALARRKLEEEKRKAARKAAMATQAEARAMATELVREMNTLSATIERNNVNRVETTPSTLTKANQKITEATVLLDSGQSLGAVRLSRATPQLAARVGNRATSPLGLRQTASKAALAQNQVLTSQTLTSRLTGARTRLRRAIEQAETLQQTIIPDMPQDVIGAPSLLQKLTWSIQDHPVAWGAGAIAAVAIPAVLISHYRQGA